MPVSLLFIKNVVQSRDRGQKPKISLDNKAASCYNEPLNIHYTLHCVNSVAPCDTVIKKNTQANKIAQNLKYKYFVNYI